MTFAELGLSSETLKAVEDAGYTEPTPIQRQAVPAVLTGQDILGTAQTGTGKTAAFTLPMIDILARGRPRARMARSLILEPTRELAAQVADSFEQYGKYNKLSMALLIGGVSFSEQERKLDRGVDVLIATPGRLLDHFQRGHIVLTGIQILVVDEADRMLDMGFIPDVERICQLITGRHQTLFFSATMPKEIQRLTDRFLNNPKRIEVSPPTSAAETVEQWLVPVKAVDKEKALERILKDQDVQNAIVFCNRKTAVDKLHRSLKSHGFNAAALHGDMDQTKRMEVLGEFKAGTVDILVASDVAARGLDIPEVSHVFNFDVPMNSEDYIHRIGRTGRAGRAGRSFMLSTPSDKKVLSAITKMLGKDIPTYDSGDGTAEPGDQKDQKAQDQKEEESGAPAKKAKGRGKGKSAGATDEKSGKKTDDAKGRGKGKSASAADEKSGKKTDEAKAPTSGHKKSGGESDKTTTAEPAKKSPAKSKGGRRNGQKDKQGTDQSGEPVQGMGNHTPDFLLKPVPKPSKTKARETGDA